ncbi:Methyl-CpG-binding domain-containing protein 4 [Dichanthelium oligosanthes]|uniref:Methyl-CpG-binding domain-containing protein 4 n=1 Tax=Dichanthelium oligosanthes TaxID=888268 RepID=A0A1E5UR00_9POAL|nr:Methyl-CpG-binding domain-containing protein 4 [Dichanthelium oligosanthes]
MAPEPSPHTVSTSHRCPLWIGLAGALNGRGKDRDSNRNGNKGIKFWFNGTQGISLNFMRKQSSMKFVALYAVKCYKCNKWRMVATKQEYETIRQDFTKNPWYCGRDPILSCEHPEDIHYDTSRVWVMDTPDIPKPPPGIERQMVVRSNLSKVDVYNLMPNGKRTRSRREVEVFLEKNPEYKSTLSASSFSFATPKIVKETVSDDAVWRVSKAARTRIGTFSDSN